MNKHFLYSLLLFASAISPTLLFSQGAGTKPELVLYRYNSSGSFSPLPVVQSDLLGTLSWRGLVSYGDIRTGASIQSFVTNPVSPGFLMANMIFRTSGAAGLVNRMIITENGLVGIGTDNPVFHLHTVGNTHTSGRFFGRIHFDTNSATDDAPNTYTDEAYFERKLRGTLGVPTPAGVNNFGGILSLAPGGGAHDHQLFFGQDGIWNRREAANNPTWSGAWEKMLSSADIAGRPNLVARFRPPGPLSSSLGDGQIFDNGANVVIGGIPAAPTVAAPAFDPADILTVSGRTQLNGNVRTSGNATVDGSTSTNSLNVATNATVSGNLGIGIAPAHKLHLAGDGYINGRLAIGPTAHYATGYALSVNGKIISDEMRVRLEPMWPDYVFEKNYALQPLAEVEKFVQENKRLPGVASAETVAAEGLDLAGMQHAQMEKIEELFLHLIALEKQVAALRSENDTLKTKVNQLENR